MAEYIERGKLRDKIAYLQNQRKSHGHHLLAEALDIVLIAIDKAPAADVAPVVHGRLILRAVSDVTSTFMCSECGREFEIANAYFGKPTELPERSYPYCNCGARMDGEV